MSGQRRVLRISTRVVTRRRLLCGNLAGPRLAIVVLTLATLVACGGLPRPERIVDSRVAGVVDSVLRSDRSLLAVEMRDGQTVMIDRETAVDLGGPGVAEGRLLLFGEDAGQTWYHSSSTLQVSSIPNCYFISGAVAFDEPDAVVFVFIEWRDIGIRLRKAEGFAPPSDALRASGRYAQGEVGHDYGSFCLNQDGLVFAVP